MHAEDIYFEQFRKWAFSFPPPWIYPAREDKKIGTGRNVHEPRSSND